ncbi:epidermal growth factor receptor kinase substrate 8-like protein 3b [Acanthopagrus schlegelii]
MFGQSRPFSYSPGGFSQEDVHLQRRPYPQDDLREAPLQRNGMFRPSGKSIYMQRKEYSETLNKQSDSFHIRVEHLFTCELDGQELKTVDDCLAKLKRLDAKGRLWPQDMIMEVQRGYVVLSDIETKAELELLPVSGILKVSAVLDSCAYDSLLTVSVQERNKRFPQVFMFQCEETGAEIIKSDLDKVVQNEGGGMEPRGEQSDMRINLGNIVGLKPLGSFRQPAPHPVQQERPPPLPDHPPPQWREPGHLTPPRVYTPDLRMLHPDPRELQSSPEPPLLSEQTEARRNTEILNHVLDDMEIFMSKVAAAVNAPSLEGDKSSKKKGLKKKKSKKNALPPIEEYVSCLQKIKCGFNLLGQLEGVLNSPTAPDYIHIFFSSLGMLLPRYPADLPATVVSPLLTAPALRLLNKVVDPEEDNLWQSLGDSWIIPRSRWPNEVPPYILEFYDGWQPPALRDMPSPPPFGNGPISRNNSQRFPPGQRQPEAPMNNGPWGSSAPPMQPREPPLNMRVMYDFMARNNRELSVMKGEVVQVIQKSKQWWLVRNTRDQEGNVPQNVLEPVSSNGPMEDAPWDSQGSISLDMSSTAAQVKAWLEYKGFSRITVNSLGVLTGKLLLGMTKDEIRTVCPEEGGKVFFQLQAIKSAIALAGEPSNLYNGRY